MQLKQLLLAGALALSVATAFAADETPAAPKDSPHKSPPSGGKQGGPGSDFMSKLADDLKLTPEQRTKYDAATKDTSGKMRDLHQKKESGSISHEEVLKLALQYHKELTAKVKDILTPEQFAKWEPAREENHHQLVAREKQRDAEQKTDPKK